MSNKSWALGGVSAMCFVSCVEGTDMLSRDASRTDARAMTVLDATAEDAAMIERDASTLDRVSVDSGGQDASTADSAVVDVMQMDASDNPTPPVDVYSPACTYIRVNAPVPDTVSFRLAGGMLSNLGCAPIDPTYWIVGAGPSVTVNFVRPQSHPAIRVWGMNTDDSASVSVNNLPYPLTALSASYNAKMVCGVSPGPDGIAFVAGNLAGANSPAMGNYSHQDVTLNAMNVSSITITGLSGAGWGVAGVTIGCGCGGGSQTGC